METGIPKSHFVPVKCFIFASNSDDANYMWHDTPQCAWKLLASQKSWKADTCTDQQVAHDRGMLRGNMFRSHGLGKQNSGLPCKYTGQRLTVQGKPCTLVALTYFLPTSLVYSKDISHESYLKHSLFFSSCVFLKACRLFFFTWNCSPT